MPAGADPPHTSSDDAVIQLHQAQSDVVNMLNGVRDEDQQFALATASSQHHQRSTVPIRHAKVLVGRIRIAGLEHRARLDGAEFVIRWRSNPIVFDNSKADAAAKDSGKPWLSSIA